MAIARGISPGHHSITASKTCPGFHLATLGELVPYPFFPLLGYKGPQGSLGVLTVGGR